MPARELAGGMLEIGLPAGEVATAKRYELTGNLSEADLRKFTRGLLCNETVEHYSLGAIHPQFRGEAASDRVENIPLVGLDDKALLQLSRTPPTLIGSRGDAGDSGFLRGVEARQPISNWKHRPNLVRALCPPNLPRPD